MIDVDRLRSETPGVAHVVHLNNAGASLMPAPVIAAVTEYLDHEAHFGGYETREARRDQIEGAYEAVARIIGARAQDISMADNATRAWDVAFYGLGLGAGDRILTTSTEYSSNLAAYFHVRDRLGVAVDVVPDTSAGDLDVDALASMIGPRTALIAINHVPTSSGVVEPASEVGVIARAHGIPYLLDACQSVGQLPVDVDEIGCDLLTSTSRKFLRGPRGVGFLWVRDEMRARVQPPFVELESGTVSADGYRLHDDRRRFETWEKNYAGIVGLGAAAQYAAEVGVDHIWGRVAGLASMMRAALASIDGVTVRDRGSTLGAIVTFDVEGWPASEIKAALRRDGINVSVSGPRASPIDGARRDLGAMVRASVHAFNTEDEVDLLTRFIAAGP